jgi:hypothetical protein
VTRVRPAAFVALLVVSSTIALGDARPFTFNYDTYPMGKGEWEYEQWVTWRTHKEDETDYDRIDFRHEFEFGLADNFDLAVYLPTWRYEDSEDRNGTKFDHVDLETIFYLSNPVTDFLGVGLYNEIKVGEDLLEFEHKILLQKDIGKWIFVYNFTVETELEGVFDDEEENEVTGELAHTFGATYAITPDLFLGGEVLVESEFADWSDYEGTTVYAGPAISYQGNQTLWVTLTPMYQLTDNEGEADFNIRLIAGLQF